MTLIPRSLFGRLLGIATLTTIAALAFAAFTIGHVLERFVIHGLDQQLDAQIGILASSVRRDGTIDRARVFSLPAFDAAGSGWSWQVDSPSGRRWAHGAAIDTSYPFDRPMRSPHRGHERGPDEPSPRPGDGRDVSGEQVHFRQLAIQTANGPVLLTASGPRRVALAPLREAMVPLLGSLALLGLGLVLATLFQLRFGLRPLRTLRVALGEVRAGRLRHIPLDQPTELAPLADELNALIDENEASLASARAHVANLAHGIKTPLAALSLQLSEAGRDPDGNLRDLADRIDRSVRHHLGRARAASPAGAKRVAIGLALRIADLTSALSHIHADRAVVVSMEIDPAITVACDPQDIDEIAGNLLDNAWRSARSKVIVSAKHSASGIVLMIEDDGPGLAPELIAAALQPGERLDEQGEGYGFGLSIARELVELYGGRITLGIAPLGGLQVLATLPTPTEGQH